jgi:predicted metal-binding protein
MVAKRRVSSPFGDRALKTGAAGNVFRASAGRTAGLKAGRHAGLCAKNTLEKFCDLARQLGAVDAKVISPKNVFTGQWVRWKCQYGCSEYGKHLTCPPHSPTPDVTRKVLDEYQYAILLRGERTAPLRAIGAELELRLFLAGYYKAFALLCGPCSSCGTCAIMDDYKEGEPDYKVRCRHPEKARPAMEAAGIDVFATTRAAGFPIEVISTAVCKQNYYALVLVE